MNRAFEKLEAFGTSLQRTTTKTYDVDDNIIALIDSLGYITSTGYDALNRPVRIVNPDGGIATTAYDPNDNVVSLTDQLGHTSTYTYDVFDRQTQFVDARGGIVTQTYDANNNRLSLTDPVSNLTQWTYDALGRKIQQTDPHANNSTYAYDANDRVISTTDRNGQQIAYSYDLLNRETGEIWSNVSGTTVSTLTFAYDLNDNLLTFAAPLSGTLTAPNMTTRTYDALDRLATQQDTFGTILTNTYDAANNRTAVQDLLGGLTTRTFDALNRMVTATFSGQGQTLREDFTYTVRDQVASQQRFSNLSGTATVGFSAFAYDAVRRLTALQHLNGSLGAIANYTNSYDLASRITAEQLNGGLPTSYQYDSTNELTNDSVATYSYDLNGNRTMAGYTTGAANQIASDGIWNYAYDKNSNIIQKINTTTGEFISYGYDNRNRMVTVSDTTASGLQTKATYVYDALGQRIEKGVYAGGFATVTRSAYEGGQAWADLSSGNVMQSRYLRTDRPLELLASVSGAGVSSWVLVDRMGSTRNVASSTGAQIDTVTYDGFGNTTQTNSASGGAYLWGGYRYDSETGLYRPDQTVSRLYIPTIGRWNCMDPIGFDSGDVNLYRYVGNNTLNLLDPSGMCAALLCEVDDIELVTQAKDMPAWAQGIGFAGKVVGEVPRGSLGAYDDTKLDGTIQFGLIIAIKGKNLSDCSITRVLVGSSTITVNGQSVTRSIPANGDGFKDRFFQGASQPDGPSANNIAPAQPTNAILIWDAPGVIKPPANIYPMKTTVRYWVRVRSKTDDMYMAGFKYSHQFIATGRGKVTKNDVKWVSGPSLVQRIAPAPG